MTSIYPTNPPRLILPSMLSDIAKRYGTPCYVYFRQSLEDNFKAFAHAFNSIHYAVKANSNLTLLQILAKLGAGFDIVSGGELFRVLKAGGNPQKIVFSGVGKQEEEITTALKTGIGCFNVESQFELDQLNNIAKSLQTPAPIALRINPDIALETHPYLATGLKENKFGIPYEEALFLYRYANDLPYLNIQGIACHLGSQIMEETPYLAAVEKLLTLITRLEKDKINISHINLGGGFGVNRENQCALNISTLSAQIKKRLGESYAHLTIKIEPGRAIVANSGILLTKVISLKHQPHKNFAIVDAAMNDLLRPALYDAWHEILPINPRKGESQQYDIVGPVCESGDFLAKNRRLCLEKDDLLMVTLTGAYGFVMSSNYNSRLRPPEVLIDKETFYLIRERETLSDLTAKEKCLF